MFEAKDWSGTRLGPVEQWPRSLLSYVALVFELPSPAIIFWGKDQTQIYNEAYSTIMGPRRHPRYFGEPYRDCWPDTYPLIYPWMVEVLEHGRVKEVTSTHIPVTRHGFTEEAYFTFTFSPLRDDEGRVAGILQPVSEATQTVLAERRTKTLHALAPRAGSTDAAGDLIAALECNAQDIPFALIYLRDDAAGTLTLATCTRNLCGRDALVAAMSAEAQEAFEANAPRPIEDLTALVGEVALGPWTEPATRALILPVGEPGVEAAIGAVVLGISPRLRFDDAYRSFFELVSGQVARAIAEVRAVREIQQRAEALAELDRAKTTFFSNVSHELRTPLTLMIGPTEDALATEDGAISGEVLETVYRNEIRLLKLVNALLDFSRIEAGRVSAQRVATDLGRLTGDIASAFRDAIARAGLAFEVDCPAGAIASVDRDMWEKIVLNLLSNALKFTFEGRILMSLRLDEDRIVLSVADTGVGIPESALPRLFERFHRVEGTRARSREGAGIGLALVHSLVQLHGGEVQVESIEGRGTTFTVRMPRVGNIDSPAPPAEHELRHNPLAHAESFATEAEHWLPSADWSSARSTAASSHSVAEDARVLVVDDNADMRQYLASLLRPHWSVDMAEDGRAALAAIEKHAPDVVLTDIMMPNVDGFELLRALREDPERRDVRVVMLSARAGEEARIEGIEAGADDYLVKPFSARELIARISAQLALGKHTRERRELLERERLAREEAEIQKQHLFSLLMRAPAPIAILRGRDFVVELANYHSCRLLNRDQAEVVGRSLFEVFPELEAQGFDELLTRVVDTGESYTGNEVETRFGTSGHGEPRTCFLNFTFTPLPDVHGRIDGVLVVGFDVTDQVVARGRISELKNQAEAANQAKDEFLAMLGHELRNPLAPILTAVELMHLRGDEPFSSERALIERQARQLVALVDDLLDVSRITRGKVELKRQHVEIEGVVANAIEMVTPLLEQRRHRLDVNVPGGLSVIGDARRLAQVVSNLLSNAAKYTEPGGAIAIRARREDGEVVLTVQDSGQGISAELLPRIFEMFSQERQALDRSGGGLGLGLSIVRSLVEMHDGKVGAASEGIGRGSTFTVRLPIAASTAPEPEETELPMLPAVKNPKRILVVDDNEDAAITLSEYAKHIGHRTDIALDGPAALKMADSFNPDIVLLDIGLPAMDGYEVAHRLRQALPRLCIIAVTGYGHTGERERAIAAGFDAHLVKPVDLDSLARLLHEVGVSA